MVKSGGGQREPDGVVVPVIGVQHNAPPGMGPDFGHARVGVKCGGMAGTARYNSPGGREPASVGGSAPIGKVRGLGRELWAAARPSDLRVGVSTPCTTASTAVTSRGSGSGPIVAPPGLIVTLEAVEEYGRLLPHRERVQEVHPVRPVRGVAAETPADQEAGPQPARRSGEQVDVGLVPRPGPAPDHGYHRLPEGSITMHRRPSPSRVRERMHGLKGGWGNRAARRPLRP
jgi:hypothetical protein